METRTVKLWSFLPWLGGALFLFGLTASPDNALVFYRSLLIIAVLMTLTGSILAARIFERGDPLFLTWSLLAGAYSILAVRYVMRLFVALKMMQTPVMFDRVLLIVHNILVPVALWLFVRAWRKTGLAAPMSAAAAFTWTLAGIVVALAFGAYPLFLGFRNTDPALFVSTLGDMIGIAMIVPLLLPALGMRGGVLMYTWLYLALAQVAWLLYDIWAVARARTGINAPWALALDQGLRAVALLYIFGAAYAQRRAIARTNSHPRRD